MSRSFAGFVRSRSVFSGAVLYIAMRWFDRLIGVVSTIVLARLLTPDDFGIVALAALVLGLATMLLDLGINIAVVQRPQLVQRDIETAWTLRLIQNTLVAALLVAAAPQVADFYHDHRLEAVVTILALAYLLDGVTSMGPVMFQKRQEYAKEVIFFAVRRVMGFAITMVLALALRSYWALVVGTLVGSLFGVALSYLMYPVAPRFTLAGWRGFLGASVWLTTRTIGAYAARELDKLVVGRRVGTAMLGAYSIADQVAAMPGSELLQPTSRALFPAMAGMQDDPQRLRLAFLASLGIQTTLALPASIGLAVVAPDLVLLMLGANWLAAVPIMQALALAYSTNALICSSVYLLMSLAQYRAQALLHWGTAAALAGLVFIVFPAADAVQIAWMRVGLGIMTVVAMAMLTIRYLPVVTLRDMLREIKRPTAASIIMAPSVLAIGYATTGMPLWIRLTLEVTGGAVVYLVALAGSWHLAGRPSGAETWVIEKYRAIRRPDAYDKIA